MIRCPACGSAAVREEDEKGVADVVRRHARPDAWIIDFTNPVGIVTRALLQAGHRAVGLCNVAIGFQRRFAATLGVPHEQVSLCHVGLNHLTWERSVTVDGVDVLPGLLGDRLDDLADEVELAPALLAQLGMVPSYYLRYYYAHDEVLAEQLREPSRASAVQAIENELLGLYADPSVDTKPEALERRGGAFYSEAAVELIHQIFDQGLDANNLPLGSYFPSAIVTKDTVDSVYDPDTANPFFKYTVPPFKSISELKG